MKKLFIVLLCCLFLIGCGSGGDIGLGRAERRNLNFYFEEIEAGRERRDILEIFRADFTEEFQMDGFKISPELALNIANEVFLVFEYNFRNNFTDPDFDLFSDTVYYIHDFEEFYIISRWMPNAFGWTYNVAIDKNNGKILSMWVN